MPWEEHESGGGYRKEGAEKGKGGFIKNPRQYEKLKAKYGKERAAAMTNAQNVNKADRPLTNAQISRKKRAQAGLSLVGGGLGVAGASALGGAAALKAKPVARMLRLKNPAQTSQKLKDVSTPLGIAGGGVGGIGALNFAPIMRAEANKGQPKKVHKSYHDEFVDFPLAGEVGYRIPDEEIDEIAKRLMPNTKVIEMAVNQTGGKKMLKAGRHKGPTLKARQRQEGAMNTYGENISAARTPTHRAAGPARTPTTAAAPRVPAGHRYSTAGNPAATAAPTAKTGSSTRRNLAIGAGVAGVGAAGGGAYTYQNRKVRKGFDDMLSDAKTKEGKAPMRPAGKGGKNKNYRTPREGENTKLSKSAFGVEHPVEKAYEPERMRRKRADRYEGAAVATAGAGASGAAITGAQARKKGFLRRVQHPDVADTGRSTTSLSLRGGKRALAAGGLAAGSGAAYAGSRQIKNRKSTTWS